MNVLSSLSFLASALVIISPAALAQGADTGRVLESVQPRPAPSSPQASPDVQLRTIPQVAPALPEAMQQVEVREFRIEGAAALSQARLQKAVEPFAGKSMTPAQMQVAADAVTQAYRDAGYKLVQAVVLPQSISNGVVVITVREDQLASVKVSSEAAPSIVQRGLSEAVPLQQALNVNELEQALLLINALPGGGRVAAEIIPPPESSSSNIVVKYTPAAKVQGSITADSGGNRFTGSSRMLVQIVINEPLNAADQLSITLLSTGKLLSYAQGAYRFPVTSRLSLGVSLSALEYKQCCQAANVTSEGSAQSFGVDAAYQLGLDRTSASTLFGNLDARRLSSERNAIEQTDRSIDAVSIGFRGYSISSAVRSWNVALRAGRANLRNNALDLAQDTTVGIQGTFSKFTANVYQSQRLSPAVIWQLQARGQLNFGRNLEGSERIALGGVDGIRAYPSGEGVGDQGWLGSTEIRYAVTGLPGLSLAAFVDVGGISRYSRNTSAVVAFMGQSTNRYTLAGAGLGMRYEGTATTLSLQVAKPIGNNRGADAAGNNNEARRDGQLQAWLSATWRF
jgi:hemolysin activation/secretion protein